MWCAVEQKSERWEGACPSALSRAPGVAFIAARPFTLEADGSAARFSQEGLARSNPMVKMRLGAL